MMEITIHYYQDVERLLDMLDSCSSIVWLQMEDGEFLGVRDNAAAVRFIYRSQRRHLPLRLHLENSADLRNIVKYLNTATLYSEESDHKAALKERHFLFPALSIPSMFSLRRTVKAAAIS